MERNRVNAEKQGTLTREIFRLLTEPEAAIMLGISTRSLVRLRTKVKTTPKLPYSSYGGVIRYNPKDLEEWARTQRKPCNRGVKRKPVKFAKIEFKEEGGGMAGKCKKPKKPKK